METQGDMTPASEPMAWSGGAGGDVAPVFGRVDQFWTTIEVAGPGMTVF